MPGGLNTIQSGFMIFGAGRPKALNTDTAPDFLDPTVDFLSIRVTEQQVAGATVTVKEGGTVVANVGGFACDSATEVAAIFLDVRGRGPANLRFSATGACTLEIRGLKIPKGRDA